MTRINLLEPRELHPKHLVSEYRELPRVFGLVRRAQARGLTPDTAKIPPAYTMGTGHVLHFYNKLGFLMIRQVSLITEMNRRNYRTTHQDPQSLIDGILPHWVLDWTPTEAEIEVSRARLNEKLVQMAKSRW
jgi:hypothetical protein